MFHFVRNIFAVIVLFTGYTIQGCQSRSSLQAEKLSNAREIDRQPKSQNLYHVYKVIDGDTFWVKDDNHQQIKIRLIGIDAPETRNAFYKKKHPLGKVGKEYLIKLIGGKEIRLDFDVDSLDRYGRTLAYAYSSTGLFINEELVRNGYAIIMTVPPNVQFVEEFYEAQKLARKERLGLWESNLSEDEIKF